MSVLRAPGTLLATLVAVVALLALASSAPRTAASIGSTTANADTVVSLEFDDATSDQWTARSMLTSHNMHATFFANSGTVNASTGNHLTWSQLHDLASDGNEIAGHTVYHVNLPTVEASSLDEAKREVCDDRVTLLNEGFNVTDFAYPYGAWDATTKQIVADCGYNSARDVAGLYDATKCADCPYAETIPPADPYRTRTPENVLATTSLATIESYVTNAEQNGGGWVQIVLHHVCDSCASASEPYAITPSDLGSFLDWLAARPSTTSVKTIQQVIGGPTRPAVAGPAATNLPGPNLVHNPSLEDDVDGDGIPDCWDGLGYGSNTATFSRVSDAHSGSWAERLDVTNWSSGAERLFVHMDLSQCSPLVTPGDNYTLGAYYKSTTPVAFELYTRDGRGLWSWWMTTGNYPASSTWNAATFTSPPVPNGATAIAFALGISNNGTLTTDDYSLVDRGVLPTPPNLLQNADLETKGANGAAPVCWERGATGTNTGSWADTTDAHSGANAEIATITSYTSGDQKLNSQQDATLPNPTLTAAAPSASGGTLPGGTYYYEVTAYTSRGETLASNEIRSTTTGSTASVALSWNGTSSGALVGYKIYRGTSSGGETLLATRTGTATTFTDDGALTPGASAPPTANTALKVAPCAPAAVPGDSYQLGAWYKTSAGATARLVVYYRDASGNWQFWKAQPIPASTDWTQATAVTGAVPAGAQALSMGISLLSTGTLTADDLSLGDLTAVDNGTPLPDKTAPTSSAGAPAATALTSITVSYTASDNSGGSGLATIDLYAKGPSDSSYSKTATDTTPGGSGSFTYTAAEGPGTYSFYTVATDNAGNSETAPTTVDATTLLDQTAPTSTATAPTSSTTTSITVSYTASDNSGGSGLATVDLWVKTPGASGYVKAATNTGSASNGSFTYAAAAGDGSYAFYTVASDQAGNREAAPATADGTTSLDTSGPGAFTMKDPGQYLHGTLTLGLISAPTDTGSGVGSLTYQYRRSGSTTWSTACTATSSPWSCKWNTGTSATPDGNYDLQAVAADRLGNPTVASNTPFTSRVIDNTKPVAKTIATTNVGTAGKAETGDSVTFTYSETLSPGSILSGWSGAATAVRVSLTDNKQGDRLIVWNASGTTQLQIANPLALGGDYVGSKGAVFNATMTQNGAAITVTLGSIVSGAVNPAAASGGTLTWTAATGATDLAGNAVGKSSATTRGPAF